MSIPEQKPAPDTVREVDVEGGEPKRDRERQAHGAGRALLVAASGVIVVAGLKAATTIIVPFLLAFFLACIALPLLNWLKSKRIPTGLAVGITIVAVVAGLSGVGFLVSGSVGELRQELPKYRARVDVVGGKIEEATQPVVLWLEDHGVDVPERFSSASVRNRPWWPLGRNRTRPLNRPSTNLKSKRPPHGSSTSLTSKLFSIRASVR